MPYRFSLTTGNVVRPIEASCLNTSTGALIWPMVYGPAGTAITMWNGVVESYTTAIDVKPSSRAGSATSYANAYDGTGMPGTTTTYATLLSGANLTTKYETYSFTGSTTYTKFKIYLTMDWESYAGWDENAIEPYYGAGALQYSLDGTNWTTIEYLPTYLENGSYTSSTPFDLGTLAATSLDNFKVRLWVLATKYPYSETPLFYKYATTTCYIKDIYINASN